MRRNDGVGYDTVSACIGAFRIVFGATPARCADISVSRSRAAKHALDAVIIPSLTWRQFRATGTEPLGFFGVVARAR
jgi:AraC-like DNA-binding protein